MARSNILLLTCTDKSYRPYQAIWEWCARAAYPEYDVIAFESKYSWKYSAACERLLAWFAEYQYTYVTDADMMLIRENPTLAEFHIREMDDTGLPYSNTVRRKEPLGSQRLTGLHFAKQEWYLRTLKQREISRELLEKGIIGNSKFDDELMLYSICVNTGYHIPGPLPLIERHHGIHLGTVRGRNLRDCRENLRLRIKPWQARKWVEYMDSGLSKEIEKITDESIKKQFKTITSFCLSRSKQ